MRKSAREYGLPYEKIHRKKLVANPNFWQQLQLEPQMRFRYAANDSKISKSLPNIDAENADYLNPSTNKT